MAVKVTVRRKNEEVPEEFVYSVLMSTLKMNREEYEKLKKEDGSVSVYVSDPEALLRLQEIGEKHSELVEVIFERDSDGNLFSASISGVKSNWGLAFSWSAVVLVLMLISLVPIIGFFTNILLSVFMYSFIIYAASELMGGSVEKVFESMSFGEIFSKHMANGFGMWLGVFIVSLVFVAVAVVSMVLFGAMGGFSDLLTYGRLREGAVLSVFVVFILMMVVGLWVMYAVPLMVSKAVENGSPTFESSFLAPFNLFKPSFIKETFSNWYLKIGGIWSLGVTVGTLGAVILSVLILTIPIALLVLYWMNVMLALCAAESARRR